MIKNLKPSTLAGIRSLAKDYKNRRKCKHSVALELAAEQAGYENYAHAQKSLSETEKPKMRPIHPLNSDNLGNLKTYHQQSLDRWGEAILSVNPDLSQSLEWTSPQKIAEVINLFVGKAMDHAHFPTGGGQDIDHIELSREEGCLEFVAGGGSRYLIKPDRLILEFIDEAPGESFLYLKTKKIKPVQLETSYVDEASNFYNTRQEVLRVGQDHYPRAHWDEYHLGHDINGDAIDIPDHAHILVRFEMGSFMIVSKGTLWNGTSKTYSGMHNTLEPSKIKKIIEGVVARKAA